MQARVAGEVQALQPAELGQRRRHSHESIVCQIEGDQVCQAGEATRQAAPRVPSLHDLSHRGGSLREIQTLQRVSQA